MKYMSCFSAIAIAKYKSKIVQDCDGLTIRISQQSKSMVNCNLKIIRTRIASNTAFATVNSFIDGGNSSNELPIFLRYIQNKMLRFTTKVKQNNSRSKTSKSIIKRCNSTCIPQTLDFSLVCMTE